MITPLLPVPAPVPLDLIREAEDAVRGRIRLWSHEISMRDTPSWHSDPVSGYQWPVDRHVRLFPTTGPPGALRRVWELNRMSWLVPLAIAFQTTGKNEFRATGWRHIDDWVRANAPGCGINWTSPLEMAMRVIRWLAFVEMTGPRLGDEGNRRFWHSVRAQTCHTAWNLSLWPRPNNHLAAEALLLLAVGLRCPGFRSARAWASLGRSLLTWMAGHVLADDGSFTEGSLGYAAFVLEVYLVADRILQGSYLPPFPSSVHRKIRATARLLAELNRHTPSPPQLGDWDEVTMGSSSADPGATLLDVERRWHETSLWCQAQTGRGPPPRPSGEPRRDGGENDRPSRDVVCDSVAAATRGQVSLLLVTGRLGLPPYHGHGHAHALSALVWLDGRPVVIDPGTCTYGDHPWREYFRSTRAHSTVEVEGVSQSVPVEDFRWRGPFACQRWASGTREEFEAVASHDGYLRLPQRVHHTRRARVSSGGVEVEDTLAGYAPFTARLHWHVHPSWEVQMRRANIVLLTHAGASVQMRISGQGTLSLLRGSLDPLLGWYSPGFERRQPTTTIRMEGRGRHVQWLTSLRTTTA